MLKNFIRPALVVSALLLGMVQRVEAQHLFNPFEVNNISYYGGPPEPNQGYFFTVEGLSMALSAPETTTIGNNTVTPPVVAVLDGSSFRTETNSLNTSWMNSEMGWGNRLQGGWVGDHWGWFVGGWGLKPIDQRIDASDVDVVFPDPPFGAGGLGFLNGFIDRNPQDGIDDDIDGDGIFGRFFPSNPPNPIDPTNPADRLPLPLSDFDDAPRLPVVFDTLRVKNRSELWSAEVMPFYRTNPTHRGARFDFGFGVRYLKFFDSFYLLGRGGVLDETEVTTWASNNIVGPQISARWFRTRGRLNLSGEGRFMAGTNFQSIRQEANVASHLPDSGLLLPRQNLPLNLNQATGNRAFRPSEFSPVVELRLQAAYQLTRALAVNVGWTGLYMDGVARGSNMIDYVLPSFGLRANENRQQAFVNGITFGIEFNR